MFKFTAPSPNTRRSTAGARLGTGHRHPKNLSETMALWRTKSMLKLFTTLARGAVAEAEQAVFDANSIRILEQQLRDAAGALEQSRRELACAMAHQASEERAVAMLSSRIAELETSGRKAIAGGRDDLAEEVAIEIAATED